MRRSNNEAHTVYGRASLLLANRLREFACRRRIAYGWFGVIRRCANKRGLPLAFALSPLGSTVTNTASIYDGGFESSRLLVNDVPLTAAIIWKASWMAYAHFYGSSRRRVILGVKPAGFNSPLIDDSETEFQSPLYAKKSRL